MNLPSNPPRKSSPSFSNRLRRKALLFLFIGISLPLLLSVASSLLAVSLLQPVTLEQEGFVIILSQPVFWAGLGVSILVALGLVWLFVQVFIIPVENLSNQAEKLANGDWSQKFVVQSKDEIGKLAYALNLLRNEMGRMYRKIERQAISQKTDSASGLVESGLEIALEDDSRENFSSEFTFEPFEFDRQEENLLYTAAQKINKAGEEAQVNKILEETLSKTDYVTAIFDLYPNNLRLMNLIDRQVRLSDKSLKGTAIQIENPQALFTGRECIILEQKEEISELADLFAIFESRSCNSIAIFPLQVNQRVVRLLIIGSRKPTPLSAVNLQPYVHLSETVSTALEKIGQIRSLRSQMTAYETLTSLSQAISNEFNLQPLYQLLHQKISEQMGADLSFSIAIFDSAKQIIQFPYHFEDGKVTSIPPFPLGEGLTSYIIQNRKSLLLPLKFEPKDLPASWNAYKYMYAVSDVERDAMRLGAKIIGKPAKSWLGVPLMLGGEVLGALIVQDTQKEERFSEKDQILLETIAPQIAISIRNAQLVERMSSTLQAYDQEHTLLNALLENVPEKIYFKDQDGRYLRVSNSFIASLGHSSASEINGYTDEELIPGEAGSLRHLKDMQVISSGIPVIGEMVEYQAENGETLWELVSRVPLFSTTDHSNQTPYALLVISQDITELKKTENLSNRQAQQLLTAAEIARDVASSLQAEQVLINATNLIRERFGYYHASVFLVDPTGKYAVLHEASGEIGQKMKAAGHRLAVGSRSLVGQAVARAETVVSNNTRQNPNYYPNPLLPDTRAELVVPLKAANRVIGALDVQSDRINAFQTEDIHTLEILADQLSMALENASLYARAQENLVKHRLLHQITTAASTSANVSEAIQRTVSNLRTALGEERVAFYLADQQGNLFLHTAIGYEGLEINQFNIQNSRYLPAIAAREVRPIRLSHLPAGETSSTIHPETRSALAVPVLFSDELLGVLSLESEQTERFDENDQEIIGALGDSLGAILTNARLVDQIRQQVERQRMLYEITSKIRRSVDIESILRTSVSEISKAIGARKAHIQINPLQHGLPLESEDAQFQTPVDHNNGHHPEANGK